MGQSLMMRKDDVTRSKQETIATQITLPNHTARYTNLRRLVFFSWFSAVYLSVCVCVFLSAVGLVLISVLVLDQVVLSFTKSTFFLSKLS